LIPRAAWLWSWCEPPQTPRSPLNRRSSSLPCAVR